MGYNKGLFLAINGIIMILAIVGLYFTSQAMQTQLDPETNQAIGDTSMAEKSVTFSLWLTYACLGLIAVFTVYALITNPKRFIPVIISLGIFALLFFITLGIADSEATGPLAKVAYGDWAKWSDVGVKLTLILILIAVAAIVFQMVKNAISFFSK